MQKKITIRKSSGRSTMLWLTIVAMGVLLALPPQLSPAHEDVQAAEDQTIQTASYASPIRQLAQAIYAPAPWDIKVPDPWRAVKKRWPLTDDTSPFQLSQDSDEAGLDVRFHTIILKISERYRVDPALIKAIIMTESSYNPRAVSDKGAEGLMQLMPLTARELGVEDSFNPEHNIDGGVRYYRKLLGYFEGDVALALAAYNAGLTMVKRYNGIPPYRQTRNYLKKVFAYYEHYKNQMTSMVAADG
jgi:soluble lytic murein transglycosylase-like protein